jgi:hypothetical protein
VPTADLASDRPKRVRGLNNANPPGWLVQQETARGLDADASHRADAPVRRSATRGVNRGTDPTHRERDISVLRTRRGCSPRRRTARSPPWIADALLLLAVSVGASASTAPPSMPHPGRPTSTLRRRTRTRHRSPSRTGCALSQLTSSPTRTGPADALHLGIHHPLRETPDHLPEQVRARRRQHILQPGIRNRHNVLHGHLVLLRFD